MIVHGIHGEPGQIALNLVAMVQDQSTDLRVSLKQMEEHAQASIQRKKLVTKDLAQVRKSNSCSFSYHKRKKDNHNETKVYLTYSEFKLS